MQREELEMGVASTDHAMECPFCGGNRLAVLDTGKDSSVSCSECKANGPSGRDYREALVRWNWLGHKTGNERNGNEHAQ